MDGKAQAVAGGALALVAVNAWTSSQRQEIAAVLNGSKAAGTSAAGHKVLLALAGEMVLVIVLSVAAASGPGVGSAMVAAVVALWVLWAIAFYSGGNRNTNPVAGVVPAGATQAA